MTYSPTRRPGYTLLEVLLASAIAALLMAALYVGMDVQLRTVQAGREKVNETAVVRNLFVTRITSDMVGVITPITATVAVTSTTGDVTTDPVTPFNGGVQGDNAVLTVWTSRLPNLPTGSDAANADSQQLNSSDLRRITYWLVDGQGLARQETDRVSASEDDADAALPPNVPDEGKYILAPEVTDLNFRYFDGESWQDSWDGTVLGTDGKTPMGPPRAIEVTMSVRRPGADPNDDSAIKQYRQVIPINAPTPSRRPSARGRPGRRARPGRREGPRHEHSNPG
jgi:prepilin-type N-terminal cleavage/methylation domain-containing protein